MEPLIFLVILSIAFQNQDQTVRAYGVDDHVWQVTHLHEAPFEARATLQFPRIGQIIGDAPCNSYRTDMHVPYPWFGTGPIRATKRACPDLALETAFLDALSEATISNVTQTTLTLSNEAGDILLTFKRAD